MDEKSRLDLPYGHFGRAEYSPEDNAWRFERNVLRGSYLQPLGVTKVLRCGDAVNASKPGRSGPQSKRHAEQIRGLLRDHPELCASRKVLPRLLRVSEAVQQAAQQFDPERRDLLAFAKIRSAGRHKDIPVAAVASGATGCVLHFMRLQLHKNGWDDQRYPHLQVPWLSDSDSIWKDQDGPILQICFSHKGTRGTALLAVRSLKSISIYRPWYGKSTGETGLGLDLLGTFETSRPDGSLCADMTFNPWFAQQVGIVHSNGHWSVSEFESRQTTTVSRKWTGSLSSKRRDGKGPLDDGWGRVFWVCDIETVAVCARTKITIFSIADSEPRELKTIYFDSVTSADWVLDVVVLADHPSKLCLLTSTHLRLYSVQERSVGVSTNLDFRLEMKIRHFQNPDDLSIRLHCWAENDEIGIVIYTGTSRLCSHYRVALNDMTVLADRPTTLELDRSELGDVSIIGISVQPVDLVEASISRSKLKRNMRRHRAEDAKHCVITALCSDLTLVQSLFYDIHDHSLQSQAMLDTCSWETKAVSHAASNTASLEDDPFIDDGDLTSSEPASVRLEPAARRRRRPVRSTISGKSAINLSSVTQHLEHAGAINESIDRLAVDIRNVLAQDNGDAHVMPTLIEFCDGELLVDDVKIASDVLQRCFVPEVGTARDGDDVGEPVDHSTALKVALIRVPQFIGLGKELGDCSASFIYDQLVNGWISSLPTQVPGWVRLAKVTTARRLAVDLMLACRTVRQEEEQEKAQTQEHDTGRTNWTLPIRPPVAADHASSMTSQNALPTPSPTGTPSLVTASSTTSTIHAQSLDRLKKYTTFEKAAPLELPRSIRNMLSHWEIGSNVDDYDWVQGSKKVSRQNEGEDDEMTEKDRKRVRKQAERHLRRQRREAAASQAQQLASSQAIEIMSASQPQVLRAESSQPSAALGDSQAQSQSQSQSQGAAASQILAGPHGGRPSKKKKRKIAGF